MNIKKPIFFILFCVFNLTLYAQVDFKIDGVEEFEFKGNFNNIQTLDIYQTEKLNIDSVICYLKRINSVEVLSLNNFSNKYWVELFQKISNIGFRTKLLYISDFKGKKIPNSINKLQSVERFTVYSNKLDLGKGISCFENLKDIYCVLNRLNKLPNNFGNLKNLKTLHLENLKSTNLPESFIQLENLSNLMITSSRLKRLPFQFGKLSNLTNIELNCPLKELPQSFENLHRLKILDVEMCKKMVKFPGEVDIAQMNKKMTNLPDSIIKLVFTVPSTKTKIPLQLFYLPQLKNIIIYGCDNIESLDPIPLSFLKDSNRYHKYANIELNNCYKLKDVIALKPFELQTLSLYDLPSENLQTLLPQIATLNIEILQLNYCSFEGDIPLSIIDYLKSFYYHKIEISPPYKDIFNPPQYQKKEEIKKKLESIKGIEMNKITID